MKSIDNKKPVTDKVSVIFMQLGLLFTVCLIAANIFEAKEIVVGSITLTGGLLIFPLTYVICRAVCEVWGFQRASLIIWMGFILNFLFMGVALLVDVIPGVASADDLNKGFHAIFGLTPRITLASCIAFLAGSFVFLCYESQKTEDRQEQARRTSGVEFRHGRGGRFSPVFPHRHSRNSLCERYVHPDGISVCSEDSV